MSEFSGAGPSYSSPFGDYDNPSGEPSPKYSKVVPTLFSPLTPSFEFSQLQLVGSSTGNSTGSTGSDDSDDDEMARERSEQLLQFENLIKQTFFPVIPPGVLNSPTDEKLELNSEDEKKRLRNTEAARRCREKIKRKTDDLEEELNSLSTHNDLMNQHRIRLLSQVEEQMRMLDIIKKRNPSIGNEISYEAKKIVDTYTQQVESKRKAIQDYFDRTCNKIY